MLDIYFIRHTSVGVSKAVCYGFSDVPLGETFELERQEVWQKLQRSGNFMSPQKIHIYTSPLQRCSQLAHFVRSKIHHQLHIHNEDRVKEMNFGDWEMQKWDGLPIDSFQTWMNAFTTLDVPNGESVKQMYDRTTDFLNYVVEKHYEPDTLTPEVVLVFAHAGSIRSMLTHCLGMPVAHTFRFGMEYGAISRVRYIQGFWKVDFVNR